MITVVTSTSTRMRTSTSTSTSRHSFYPMEPITEADLNETISTTNVADHPIIQKKKDEEFDTEDYCDNEVSSFFLNHKVLQSTIDASSDTNETGSELTEE